MPSIILKLCGNKSVDSAKKISPLHPPWMGFIFYPHSKRFFKGDISQIKTLPCAKKVGVFVDQSIDEVERIARSAGLDYIQLHGKESPEYCERLSKKYKIIKAFGIKKNFDFKSLEPYEKYGDYFLLDTSTPLKGGSGIAYDRNILKDYPFAKPYFISGGIDLQEALSLLESPLPSMAGIDINSRFELENGEKDNALIQQLLLSYYGNISE